MRKVLDFFRRHLIVTNLLIMIAVTFVLLILLNWFMSAWTNHGDEQKVPDVHDMTMANARATLSGCGLQIELMDSVYNEGARPGTIVEQHPSAGSTVKTGRTIFVTVNAVNPPQVQIPALVGNSLRQARASLMSLGFDDIREVRVPSDYKDLVIAVKSMGVNLRPGTRLPKGSTIVLEIGEGYIEPEVTDSLDFYEELPDDEWTNYYD